MFRWLRNLLWPQPAIAAYTTPPRAAPAPESAPPPPPPPQPVPLLRQSIAFIDVETTGFHSRDRMVSLGLVLLTSLDQVGRDVTMRARHVHYIFDPGFKGSIDAEKVHGYDDWLLRHQDPFAAHADQIAELLASADLICAHNMDFDWSFIERAFNDLGRAPPSRRLFCTMEAARRSERFTRASLRHVAGALGHHQPAVHSALHDAFLCMIVYLDLELGLSWPQPFAEAAAPPSNLRPTPPRPDILPRRKARKRAPPPANPLPE